MKIYNITIKREIVDLTEEDCDEEEKDEIQPIPQIRWKKTFAKLIEIKTGTKELIREKCQKNKQVISVQNNNQCQRH